MQYAIVQLWLTLVVIICALVKGRGELCVERA